MLLVCRKFGTLPVSIPATRARTYSSDGAVFSLWGVRARPGFRIDKHWKVGNREPVGPLLRESKRE